MDMNYANNPYNIFPWGMQNQYPNPWFNVANQYTPRNLQDLIRWVKYITLQSPTVTEVIRKFSTYPITDLIIDTKSEKTKGNYEELFRSLKMKEVLQNIGFQYWTLGNVFVSLYFPINRSLKCNSCGSLYPAKNAKWARFAKFKFMGTCPKCGNQGDLEILDSKSYSIEDLNVIIWDPADISTEHNPLTGETNYYYSIPKHIRTEIIRGNRLFVDTIPLQVIEAVRKNEDFKFDRRNFFHMRNISTGGSVDGVAIPPFLSLFSLVFYQATLRRANEAVAMEYIAPMRIVSPTANGSTDPVMASSMRKFKEEIEKAFKRHKQDPNYVMVSPLPLQYQLAGGEGKTLLVSQELDQTEQQLLLSLGVSQELLSGTTNWTSSHVGLRLLENTLSHYTTRLNEMIEWIMTKVTTYMSYETVDVELTPVKLLDDDSFRQTVAELFSNQQVSKQTLYETLGLDLNKEIERQVKEAGMESSMQVRAQIESEVAQYLASRKAYSEVSGTEEYQAAIKKASAYVQQLQEISPLEQQQMLLQLKAEDFSMWLLVQNLKSKQQPQEPQEEEQQPQEQQEQEPTDGNDTGNSTSSAQT